MKRIPLLALLVFLAALLLSACREPIPTAGSSAAGTGATSAEAITVARAYATPDLALLVNTGRPQLLNFYADW